ncbi:PDR/VanB family oxidoreductase [Microbacterium testaceum]|uniref:PDR/VanB family oxidoreductase n=1 Tax=Microbacterium testaceum TaxID=2033 RepID=UPI0022E78402|nr:PDR/VanB family oxidoreductase [Microbacterium testaceum]
MSEPVRDAMIVRDIVPLSADVVGITLAFEDGRALPPWAPGDHIDIELERGLTRQYSLCGSAEDAQAWSVAVRRDRAGRGGSAFAHERLRPGHRVRVAGPRARFVLEDASSYVLVAGGIGITPILTMAERLARSGKPFRLYYFDRGSERMVFADRLAALGPAAVVVDRDLDATTTLAHAIGGLAADALVYACGPTRMLSELTLLIEPTRLRVEDFSPARETGADPATADGESTEDDAFEVQLGREGEVHPVPAGCSLLDVLLGAGVDVMWSCREGNCASCETPVLDGVPDHRDVILTEDERAANDVIFPCVSRARSGRLVLDV